MFYRSVETVFVMIILIGIGWIMSYKGWVSDDVKSFLSKVIIKVCIPALAITNFFDSFPKEMLILSTNYIAIALVSMMVLLIISKILSYILKIEPIKTGSFISMSTVSNSMFFGLPITLSLFGDVSLPYILFYYIANTLVFWGICSPMIAKDGGISNDGRFKNLKNILNIPLLTVIIAGVLLYFNFSPPTIVLKVAKYFSNLVTPLASIVVGKIIYDIDFKRYKFDKSILMIIFMRFVISPAIMFTITRIFKLPVLVSQVLTIQAAMPVMMQTTIVSETYKTDSKYVATALSITTILSLFFIPLYILIMEGML